MGYWLLRVIGQEVNRLRFLVVKIGGKSKQIIVIFSIFAIIICD